MTNKQYRWVWDPYIRPKRLKMSINVAKWLLYRYKLKQMYHCIYYFANKDKKMRTLINTITRDWIRNKKIFIRQEQSTGSFMFVRIFKLAHFGLCFYVMNHLFLSMFSSHFQMGFHPQAPVSQRSWTFFSILIGSFSLGALQLV